MLLDWLDRVLLKPGGWIQLLVLIGAVLLAFALRLLLGRWLQKLHARSGRRIWQYLIDSVLQNLPVLTPFLALVITGLSHAAMDQYDVPTDALRFGGKILFIWLVLQSILCFVRSTFSRLAFIAIAGIFFTLDLLDLLDPAVEASRKLTYHFGKIKISLYGVLNSAIALTVLLWLTGALQRGSERVLRRLSLRGTTQQLVLKTLTVVLYCIVALVALSILGVDVRAFAVFGGALGVGIGFGLQKIASNFISGIILLLEGSIEVNDQITLDNGTTGFVRRTGARYTTIDTDDGRVMMVPNEQFITATVINNTQIGRKGKVDIRLYVAYESDLALVREIMLEKVRADDRVMKDPAPSCFIATFKEGFVEMVSYFWVPDITKGKLGAQTDIFLAIMAEFRARHIAIPTPFPSRYLTREGSYTYNNAIDLRARSDAGGDGGAGTAASPRETLQPAHD